MIFVEVTSSIGFAVVTSSLNEEGVELSLANKTISVARGILQKRLSLSAKLIEFVWNAFTV